MSPAGTSPDRNAQPDSEGAGGQGSAPDDAIPGSRAPAPGLMIGRAVPRSKPRQAAGVQPHSVRSPAATVGGTVLTTMSQPMAQRCKHDPVPRSSPGRCPSRPGAILPASVRPSRTPRRPPPSPRSPGPAVTSADRPVRPGSAGRLPRAGEARKEETARISAARSVSAELKTMRPEINVRLQAFGLVR